jgi:hypothetical protein
VLPNFAALDVKAQVVHAQPVPLAGLVMNAAYALTFIGALLTAATLIFRQRDFK